MRILTIDVEDWYNHDDYSRDFGWEKHEARIGLGTEKILSALSQKDIKGSFFCLGWIAEHHPQVIKDIAKAGHHIGCHSYQHELASRFTPKQFREDTYKAKCIIEDVSGCEVNAFRVPSFSVTINNLWVFDILTELGFKYDSSVLPLDSEFGGIPTFPEDPFLLHTHSGSLKEFPISIVHFMRKRILYSGGGYFRVMPYSLIKRWTSKYPYVLSYFHPSDFDPGQPQMPHLSKVRQIKNRVGLNGAFIKFQKYIKEFDFYNIETASSCIDWSSVKKINIDELR